MTEQVKDVAKGRPPKMLVFGVDVSDPENPKYRAMQVDKYGRLVVSPEYLKLDGSNSPMTGTLTLGDIGSSPYYDLALKFGAADLGFRRYGTNLIQLVNAAGDLKNLQVSGLRARYVQSPSNQNLEIQAYETGVGDLTIAKGIYGATPYFEISRAGDIIPAVDIGHNLGSGAKQFNAIYCGGATVSIIKYLSSTLGFWLPTADVGADSSAKIYWDDANQDLYIYSSTTGAWEKVHLA